MAIVRLSDDRGRRFDQPAQNGFVFDDLGVELDVRGGRDGVHQLGEVIETADRIELATAKQLIAESDVVDDRSVLGERKHGAEEPPVRLAIEHRVVHQLRGAQCRILIEQHGAEHRLLRFLAPGSGTPHIGISGRVVA
jgi:hypothetical protein